MANIRKRMPTKFGDILTSEDIEALAAEAEAGYDLSQARRQMRVLTVTAVTRPATGGNGACHQEPSYR